MNKLLVKPGTCWFEQVSNPERCNVAEQLVHKLSQQCQDQLLKDDIQHYKTCKYKQCNNTELFAKSDYHPCRQIMEKVIRLEEIQHANSF